MIVVAGYVTWLMGNLGAFGLNMIQHDVVSYYSYTPAVFIKKDISLSFYKDSARYYCDRGMYCANKTKEGNPVLKTTYGVSLMYIPFTIWPLIFSQPGDTGFELPYSIAISASSLFYFLASLLLLRKLLQMLNFSDNAIACSIFCVGLGTNLLAYSAVRIGLAHVYDFFLLTASLVLVMKYFAQPRWIHVVLLGFTFGLLILNRPTNIVLVLTFVLFRSETLKSTLALLLKNYLHLVCMALIAFGVVLPQLLYWKMVSGHYLYNSYVGERFYFSNPHVLDFLVGFRKGWLVYTPLVIVALIGLCVCRGKNPFTLSSLIIIPALIFINSAWWCWWFGGGFGARAMIEVYPLLAIGFASFYERFSVYKRTLIGMTTFLILFNIKSVNLFRVNVIHYDSMTFDAYVRTLYKITLTDEEKIQLEKFYQKPDYEKALAGEDT